MRPIAASETFELGHPEPEGEAGKRQRQPGDEAIRRHDPEPPVGDAPAGWRRGKGIRSVIGHSHLPAPGGLDSAMGGLRANVIGSVHGSAGTMMRILARAFRLITRPEAEWRSIAVEPTTPGQLFAYAAVLAAIPPSRALLGYSVVGVSLGIRAPHLGFRSLSGLSARSPVMSCGSSGVYVIALIVRALAPRFEGRADLVTGLKVAAHAPTALWLAGVFVLVPPIGWLSLIGLYSIYTLAIGLPIVTRCPPDESLWFVGATILAFIAIVVIAGIAGGASVPGLVAPSP